MQPPHLQAHAATRAEHKEKLVEWLGKKRPLRLRKIHALLVRDHGLVASYDTVRRYAMDELAWK